MERKRIMVVGLAILLVMLVYESRLFYMQALNARRFSEEFERYVHDVEVIPPGRGKIVDRNGVLLAYDERTFDLYVILKGFEKSPNINVALANILGKPVDAVDEAIGKINEKIERIARTRPKEYAKMILREKRTPYLLFRDIGFDAAYHIECRQDLYPGAVVAATFKRAYPEGESAAHIVGYLGRMTEDDFSRKWDSGYFTSGFADVIGEEGIELLGRRGYFQDELVGKSGVELSYQEQLRGGYGVRINERNVFRGLKETIGYKPSACGEDITLTIDIVLQKIVDKALAGRHGAAVVIDVTNGEVLAMASAPTFNPNLIRSPEMSKEYFGEGGGNPMLNRTISGRYQVGSVFKIATAVAALSDGKITPDRKVTCTGKYSPTSSYFNCWSQHGEVALEDAIARSCNVFFFDTGKRAGPESIAHWGGMLGLGGKTGIDLPEEADGIMPTREWKASHGWGAWNDSDTLSMAIGQGYVTATPLQAATMMAIVANGGIKISPHVVKSTVGEMEKLPIDANVLKAVCKGMYNVVHESYGTAFSSGLRRYGVAGKTSTAQTIKGKEDHAWFAGFMPFDKPRYAFVMMVEHGGHGGAVAAPLLVPIAEYLSTRN